MQPGLRELKKSQTRQLIATTAAQLFARSGFDHVTVDEIAQAAQVSKKTVFNYFPTKEDLVFDRAEDRETSLLATVRSRGAGVTVLDALRELLLAQAADLDELRRDSGQGSGSFFDLVRSTPALQRKMHELNLRLVRSVAGALAEQTGAAPGDPVPQVVAWTLIGAHRSLQRRLRERVSDGAGDLAITRAHRRDVDRVITLLAQGLAGYADPAL
jgi:AcrR family transcriptional regulator